MDNERNFLRGARNRQSGAVLVVALIILAVMTLLGVSAMQNATMQERMSGQHKQVIDANMAAEVALKEGLDALREDDSIGYVDCADDWDSVGWREVTRSDWAGLGAGWCVAEWDGNREYNGQPIRTFYLRGASDGGTRASVVAEASRTFVTANSALYSEGPMWLQSSSASASGLDICGDDDKYGAITPSSIDQHNNFVLEGEPSPDLQGSDVYDEGYYINVAELVSDLVGSADGVGDFDAIESEVSGNPQFPEDGAPSCSGDMEVHHYDTTGMSGNPVANGLRGCGLLVVEGDIRFHGGLEWYGLIVASGEVVFGGGGSADYNVAGAVMAGGEIDGDDAAWVTGGMELNYCSSAMQELSDNMSFAVRSWRHTTNDEWTKWGD